MPLYDFPAKENDKKTTNLIKWTQFPRAKNMTSLFRRTADSIAMSNWPNDSSMQMNCFIVQIDILACAESPNEQTNEQQICNCMRHWEAKRTLESRWSEQNVTQTSTTILRIQYCNDVENGTEII